MSRKIIIITRDTAYVGNEALVERIPKSEERGKYPSGCFSGFESLYKEPFYAKDEQGKYAVQIDLLGSKLSELGFDEEYLDDYTEWLDGKHELIIDEKLVKVFKRIAEIEPCKYMDHILLEENGKNDDVYLFYWNVTKETITDTWRMLALICKDCDIDFANETSEDNMLYIHDDEWSEKGIENNVLIFDHIIKYNPSKSHEQLLEKLKNKFSHVYSFQHNNAEGMIFKDILNCNFGEQALSNLLGEKEVELTTYESLRDACINVILKDKSEE